MLGEITGGRIHYSQLGSVVGKPVFGTIFELKFVLGTIAGNIQSQVTRKLLTRYRFSLLVGEIGALNQKLDG